MAIRPKDIYQGRKKSRWRAGVIIAIVLVLIVGTILLFYGLRQYAVYNENGEATIVFPWSHNGADDTAESPSESPSHSSSASPSLSPSASPSPNPVESAQVSPSAEVLPEETPS